MSARVSFPNASFGSDFYTAGVSITAQGMLYGSALESMPDTNGDGVPEVLIGAPFEYEYGPEGTAMPDVTVTCVNKELLVEADPPDWKPADGYEPARHPVYQITFANPEGPDAGGNTDFETIGCCIDRGDAVKFHFDHGAKAFSVCAERPGSFDICAKICAQPHCAAHPPVQDLCKANQRAPWQTRTAAPPATWSTWRSATRSTASSTGRASAPAASAARARTWL